MRKTLHLIAGPLTLLLSYGVGLGQPSTPQAYVYRLKTENVVRFENLEVKFGNISLQLGPGGVALMETSEGFVGALVMAPGRVEFKSDDGKQAMQDEIESATLTLDLAKSAGPYKKGVQQVPLPAYRRHEAELAAAVRGERTLSVSVDEELLVAETVLRTSDML